jgi:predicted metallopeptidase
MRYEYAEDLQNIAEEISLLLFPHIDISRVKCFRSKGSSSKNTIARCHTIGKLMQMAIGTKAHYAIEFLELYEKQPEEEKIKTIIHELMHIPKAFGGGFRHHDWVCDNNVNKMYVNYVASKKKDNKKEENPKNDSEDILESVGIPVYKTTVEKEEKKIGIKRWF